MTESEFRCNSTGAKTLARFSEFPENDYWSGYQHGLLRHYHGERFGTTDEHRRWLSLANETRDIVRRFRGIGYRAGFKGLAISAAIKHLEANVAKSLDASATGSVRSEGKLRR